MSVTSASPPFVLAGETRAAIDDGSWLSRGEFLEESSSSWLETCDVSPREVEAGLRLPLFSPSDVSSDGWTESIRGRSGESSRKGMKDLSDDLLTRVTVVGIAGGTAVGEASGGSVLVVRGGEASLVSLWMVG